MADNKKKTKLDRHRVALTQKHERVTLRKSVIKVQEKLKKTKDASLSGFEDDDPIIGKLTLNRICKATIKLLDHYEGGRDE